jgi:hypothetical protein
MSRKSKKRRPKTRPTLAPAKFLPNTPVRVKAGTKDHDFPDMPLGGWSGTVSKIKARPGAATYLIEWDQRTLEAMHPAYRQRCERADLEVESMWLDENDIEPAAGGDVVPIEQPTRLVPRPLRSNDPDDRIRAVFGLTSDDPLPGMDQENLRRYQRHLAEKLRLPFQARCEEEIEPYLLYERRITVTALLDADEADKQEGLLCEVEDGEKFVVPLTEVLVRSGPNRQLLGDYRTWLWNCQDDGALEFVEPRPGLGSVLKVVAPLCLAGGFCGATLGAAWAAVDSAPAGIAIGRCSWPLSAVCWVPGTDWHLRR